MSEHMSITGKCDFWHLPFDWEGGFAYCHHCKKVKRSLSLELHNGICSDWIKCVCPGCKKTIWVAELTNYHCQEKHKHTEDCDPLPRKWKTTGDNGRVLIRDNKKCHVCKKPTNNYDAVCVSYGFNKKSEKYFCSEKCEKKHFKDKNEN